MKVLPAKKYANFRAYTLYTTSFGETRLVICGITKDEAEELIKHLREIRSKY